MGVIGRFRIGFGVGIFLLQFCSVGCLVLLPIEISSTQQAVTNSVSTDVKTFFSQKSSHIDGTVILASLNENIHQQQPLSFSTKGFQKDQVARILDGNTIKLQKNGLVNLAGVRMPTPGNGNFQFPECMTYNPTYKLRQLTPPKSNVLIKIVGANSKAPQAIVVRSEDSLIVNQELVRTGYAKIQPKINPVTQQYLDVSVLQRLQENAKATGLGIFKRCDGTSNEIAPEAQFEPLEWTMEIQWGDDGGKLVLKQKEEENPNRSPSNPGDKKGCSDFSTYEDALRFYEYYKPYYGDVAKLDRDGDGVPCPGLPHTTNRDKYRMKVPDKVR